MSGRFPGEPPEYRSARDRLLEAEAERNVLDVTPEGRGADWNPELDYGDETAAPTGPSTRST